MAPRMSTNAERSARSEPISGQQARPAANKVVIGSGKTGPIKAVTAVKRRSVVMSRLRPGTGEEAVKRYVKDQTGADEVIAEKLKTRYDSYESYHLDIVNPSCDDVFNPEIWAQVLVVRRFFARRQSPGVKSSATVKPSPSAGSAKSRW